jgi:acyl carrier protein
VPAHLAGLRAGERVSAIQAQVTGAISAVLGREISADEPLMDAGLDSLGMAEVSSAIVAAVGVQLPSTVTFDYPSVAEISAFVDSQLFPAPALLAGVPAAQRLSAIQQQVGGAIATVLGRDLDPDEPLMDAGLDSLGMAEASSAIASAVGVQLPATLSFDYPTLGAISLYIHDELFHGASSSSRHSAAAVFGGATALSAQPATLGSGAERRTAIVGMGMRLPKTVSDCQALWEMVVTGGDAITKVPLERWDVDLHTASGLVHRRRDAETEHYSRHGSFVEGLDMFDNAFFGVTASDAAEMDPQQRVLIQVCAEAMYLGGMEKASMRNSNTAVIIGIWCAHVLCPLVRTPSANQLGFTPTRTCVLPPSLTHASPPDIMRAAITTSTLCCAHKRWS